MTYTFDDAIEELEKLQGSAGYATQGEPEALRFSGLDVNWFLNEATQVIEKLREEYVPTIEMTKAEKVKLLDYLEMSNLQEFMEAVTYEDELYENISFEDIANSWLHPETIKVVDE